MWNLLSLDKLSAFRNKFCFTKKFISVLNQIVFPYETQGLIDNTPVFLPVCVFLDRLYNRQW